MKSEGDCTGHFALTIVNQVNRETQVQVKEDRELATFSPPRRRKLVHATTTGKKVIWKQTAQSSRLRSERMCAPRGSGTNQA